MVRSLIHPIRAYIYNLPANHCVVLAQCLHGTLGGGLGVFDHFKIDGRESILLHVEAHVLTAYRFRTRHRQDTSNDDREH